MWFISKASPSLSFWANTHITKIKNWIIKNGELHALFLYTMKQQIPAQCPYELHMRALPQPHHKPALASHINRANEPSSHFHIVYKNQSAPLLNYTHLPARSIYVKFNNVHLIVGLPLLIRILTLAVSQLTLVKLTQRAEGKIYILDLHTKLAGKQYPVDLVWLLSKKLV